MAEVTMTPNERDSINSILQIAKELPKEDQDKLYYIGVGLAYSTQKDLFKEENEYAEDSTN